MSDIDDIVAMLDSKMMSGVGRLRLQVSDTQEKGTVNAVHHHGRCDVGSPWAKGTVTNCDEIDMVMDLNAEE